MIGNELEFLRLGQREVEKLEVGENLWVRGANRNGSASTVGLWLRARVGERS